MSRTRPRRRLQRSKLRYPATPRKIMILLAEQATEVKPR